MFAFVARQPIVNQDQQIVAYELLFRDGEDNCFPNIDPDEATSKLLAAGHLTLGLEEITGPYQAFINFHRETLLHRFPTSLDKKHIVIEVLETVSIDAELIQACQNIHEMGYQIALDDYDSDPKWDAILPYISIVKFDVTVLSHDIIAERSVKLREHGITLVAERVETREEFEFFKSLNFDLFQGYFFARPEIVRHRKLGPSKLSMLELIAISSEVKFDFDKVNAILERDASLTFMLLRFINNPLFNKRNRINSLRHALTYMGELEVKKFIALMALANLAENQPQEILHMSLVRAKFCELTSLALDEPENPPTGFLTGLLSLMDTLTAQTMRTLVNKVPLHDSVKDALCGQEGHLNDCLLLVEQFEQANWQGIRKLADKYQLKQVMLHHFYNEALKWAQALQREME